MKKVLFILIIAMITALSMAVVFGKAVIDTEPPELIGEIETTLIPSTKVIGSYDFKLKFSIRDNVDCTFIEVYCLDDKGDKIMMIEHSLSTSSNRATVDKLLLIEPEGMEGFFRDEREYYFVLHDINGNKTPVDSDEKSEIFLTLSAKLDINDLITGNTLANRFSKTSTVPGARIFTTQSFVFGKDISMIHFGDEKTIELTLKAVRTKKVVNKKSVADNDITVDHSAKFTIIRPSAQKLGQDDKYLPLLNSYGKNIIAIDEDIKNIKSIALKYSISASRTLIPGEEYELHFELKPSSKYYGFTDDVFVSAVMKITITELPKIK